MWTHRCGFFCALLIASAALIASGCDAGDQLGALLGDQDTDRPVRPGRGDGGGQSGSGSGGDQSDQDDPVDMTDVVSDDDPADPDPELDSDASGDDVEEQDTVPDPDLDADDDFDIEPEHDTDVEEPEQDIEPEQDTDTDEPFDCHATPECAMGDTRCSDDVLERCEAVGADNCLTWIQERDCTVAGVNGYCMSQGAISRCEIPPDPCEGLENACDDEGTTCADGNLVSCGPNDDGCLVAELVEHCTAQGNICDSSAKQCVEPVCGDGVIDSPIESCDTGSSSSAGCLDCQTQAGWVCAGSPSECYEQGCGNGILEPELGEECDDGNLVDGDGCSADCKIEMPDVDIACLGGVRQRLSCPGGTLNDSNVYAPNNYPEYPRCNSYVYDAGERIYQLTTPTSQRVTISLRGSDSYDLDLIVLQALENPPVCSNNMHCAGSSEGGGSTETVTFTSQPGATYAVVVKGWDGGDWLTDPDETSYTLTWTCSD